MACRPHAGPTLPLGVPVFLLAPRLRLTMVAAVTMTYAAKDCQSFLSHVPLALASLEHFASRNLSRRAAALAFTALGCLASFQAAALMFRKADGLSEASISRLRVVA